ncbi:helix-turn-helix transcriptional regulator [Asticcacaulis sp. SL142]|uniref:helix-turn-helix transcriptional regulator n=1 Tax=Asticcacaulis sp. SL142 TaxID=2995155 RepID=UPI003B638DE0
MVTDEIKAYAVEPKSLDDTRIVRLPEVKLLTGLSRSTVYERVKAGRFPKPIPLGGRSVGWLECEVRRWIFKQVETARAHDL